MAPNILAHAFALLLAMPLLAAAQGLPAEWEVRDLALALGKQMDLLVPALARFDTAHWTGAPAAYAEQRDLASHEAAYAADAAREVAEKPLGLGKAFELHLRIQAVESLVNSLSLGARTYQPGTPVDEPLEILGAAASQHSKLRDYIMELATSKDQELSRIDAEAQRCRSEMLRAPAPTKPTKAKASK